MKSTCHCLVRGSLLPAAALAFLLGSLTPGPAADNIISRTRTVTTQRIAGSELDGVEIRVEPRRRNPPPPQPEAPFAWPPPGAKTTRYESLQLRGLSGPRGAQLALINNETFRSNDTASVSIGDKRVRVQCLSVGEKSVLVKVEGEPAPRELKLISLAPIPAALPPRK